MLCAACVVFFLVVLAVVIVLLIANLYARIDQIEAHVGMRRRLQE